MSSFPPPKWKSTGPKKNSELRIRIPGFYAQIERRKQNICDVSAPNQKNFAHASVRLSSLAFSAARILKRAQVLVL
jgi:hypothetical protein